MSAHACVGCPGEGELCVCPMLCERQNHGVCTKLHGGRGSRCLGGTHPDAAPTPTTAPPRCQIPCPHLFVQEELLGAGSRGSYSISNLLGSTGGTAGQGGPQGKATNAPRAPHTPSLPAGEQPRTDPAWVPGVNAALAAVYKEQ